MNNAFYRRFNRMSSKPERSSIEMIVGPFLPSCIQEDILYSNIYANNICNFSNPSCSIMLFEKKHCVRFNKFTLRPPKEKFGFFGPCPGLPKCPFCLLAVSSTFILCCHACRMKFESDPEKFMSKVNPH